MQELLFHPKLVHVPIALGVLMPIVASGLLLAWHRGWLPGRVWTIAVVLQLVLVSSGVLALRTGEAEEERVERVVAERFIEQHEQAAEAFVWASILVLAAMFLTLLPEREHLRRSIALGATIGTLAVLALGYRTGEAGGALVYRHGAARAYSSTPPVADLSERSALASEHRDAD